jgi:ppGpp synthetase/RelA/SpoT-type nucleotidyltranferase
VEEADLRRLDEYRLTFAAASDSVATQLKSEFNVPLTLRSAKSTQAIVEKLRRQSCRLGQIQDIAGCRLVVVDAAAQDTALRRLLEMFPSALLYDRRSDPSHSYRAVHLVVRRYDRTVEIQLRTALQDLWATLSEKLADWFGNEVKYGGGPDAVRQLLKRSARLVASVERDEQNLVFARLRSDEQGRRIARLREHAAENPGQGDAEVLIELEAEHTELARQLVVVQSRVELNRELVRQMFSDSFANLEGTSGS